MGRASSATSKILTWSQAVERFGPGQQRQVVFTNGCFDILHAGHVTYLQEAREFGDALVLGLNSDESVSRQGKGPSRPFVREAERALVLAALTSVDAVVVFEEDTPLALIKAIQPSVLVKGGDYEAKDVVGKTVVEARGGRVVILPLVAGQSTTGLISRIRSSSEG